MATSQRRSTGYQLVTQLMKSMGMSPPTTVAGSTDKQAVQFWQLATDVGQKLAQGPYKWQRLTKEFTITTIIGTASYALPSDFDGFIPDSEWNRTTRLPVIGGLEEFEWQMLKARLTAGTTFTNLFRLDSDNVVFYDTPTAIQTIVMPYTSRGWVENSAALGTFQDNLILDADIVQYDPQLFKAALKLAFYTEKQFDTTKVRQAYKEALSAAMSNDSPGRTLSLSRGSDYPYLGVLNLPDTGYGP